MTTLLRFFLALYLGNLFADFVLQSHALIAQKRAGQLIAYAQHGLIHYLCAAVLAGFFVPGSFFSIRTHAVLVALTLSHLLIDSAKIRCTAAEWITNGTRAFLGDQLLHVATVLLAAKLLTPDVNFAMLLAWLGNFRWLPNKFLSVPVVYIAVIFGGGYLVRFLTRTLAEGIKSHSPDKPSEQLGNAGLYIGWLERFLVITAMLLQSPATVGLILTAKSIARYPEFKSERFAEYFLIGTLLSISLAIVGGAILSKIIFGKIRFAG